MPEIRAAVADDAEVLALVAAETFPMACPPHTTAEAIAAFIAANLSVDAFRGYLADSERELFLALEEDEPAGYTMLAYGDPVDADVAAAITARPTAELSKVYVREAFHGTGLSRALVERSIEAARERGAHTLWLGVNQENERANRFYGKNGFERVGTKRFLVGDRYEDDFVRELVL
ncbi:MAG TPA: GNAT family N-acetyltransferase [Rhodoglobus sp.]|nr:GNAT family N-acetyltransferase [Rhodoglobus sp.]